MRGARRIGGWLDDRLGISSNLKPIIEHRVPPTGWDYALGTATLAAFAVQVITGVALAFTYVPEPKDAYASIQFITDGAILGSVVRGIHYWGATAMVLLVLAHMAQVFLIGAYKFPREMNWLTGTILLLMTFGMAFTGQLLRWDQDAYWAVVVGAAQAARAPIIGNWLVGVLLAGQTVGGATLTRFYATHVFLIPGVIIGLVTVHLYLVLRHGISEPPKPGELVDSATYREKYAALVHKVGVPFWPDAAWKDVVFSVGIGLIVVALAVIPGPPSLGKPADPTIIQAYPRPDWYFLWYFALLALIPPNLEDYFIVGFPLLLGVLMLSLPFIAPTGERSPQRRPWAVATIGFAAISVVMLLREGYRAPWSPVFNPAPLPASVSAPLSGAALQGSQEIQKAGCVNCHIIAAGIGGERGPDLSQAGARLSRNELVSRILNGGNNMPAYANILQPDQVDALVAFLEAQRGSSAAPAAGPQ